MIHLLWNKIQGRDPKAFQYLFLIGGMKCGTTTLANVLRQHPNIFKGSHKEPHFFSTHRGKHKNWSGYMKSWPLAEYRSTRPAYLLDASTSYSKFPSCGNAAAKIYKHTTNPKFIYCVRNPLDRIESQIAHYMARNPKFADYFEARKHGLSFYEEYIEASQYAVQLGKYTEYFPSSAIHIILFEDICNNMLLTLENLSKFLGLPSFQDITVKHQNERRDFLKDKRLLPEGITVQLRDLFLPEMKRFGGEWGIDVSRWGFE